MAFDINRDIFDWYTANTVEDQNFKAIAPDGTVSYGIGLKEGVEWESEFAKNLHDAANPFKESEQATSYLNTLYSKMSDFDSKIGDFETWYTNKQDSLNPKIQSGLHRNVTDADKGIIEHSSAEDRLVQYWADKNNVNVNSVQGYIEYRRNQEVSDTAQNIVDDLLNNEPKAEEQVNVQPEAETTVESNTTESAEKNASPKPKATESTASKPKSNFKTGKLSGKGAAAIVIGSIAGAAILTSNQKKKKESRKKQNERQRNYTNSTMQYSGYEQQLASDISTYRYGKHITGFVNP